MIGFSANAMPPRVEQLPRWMWETGRESEPRPAIFSSSVTVRWSAARVIVPLAVTPGSGASLKSRPLGLGDGDGLEDCGGDGDGELEAVVPPPHAIAHKTIAAAATHNLSTTAAGYLTDRCRPPHSRGDAPAREGRGGGVTRAWVGRGGGRARPGSRFRAGPATVRSQPGR